MCWNKMFRLKEKSRQESIPQYSFFLKQPVRLLIFFISITRFYDSFI